MRIENVRVNYCDENRGGNTKRLKFAIAEPKKEREQETSVRTRSMMIKIGLCGAAVVLALILRVSGVEKPAKAVDAQDEQGEEETLGALHFVDAAGSVRTSKWDAPVNAIDVELILDSGIVRYTAAVPEVKNCIAGEVTELGEDMVLGQFVKIANVDGIETIYFGMKTIDAIMGQVVDAGATLGTVDVGRSVYLCILKDGEPQDPVDYVSINIGG